MAPQSDIPVVRAPRVHRRRASRVNVLPGLFPRVSLLTELQAANVLGVSADHISAPPPCVNLTSAVRLARGQI
jgi:hypothetical protein